MALDNEKIEPDIRTNEDLEENQYSQSLPQGAPFPHVTFRIIRSSWDKRSLYLEDGTLRL